jgi:F0F1-type ATP synthase membrane subunit b/b'
VGLRDRIADLAVTAAGRIIEKNLDARAHHALIDDILNDVK